VAFTTKINSVFGEALGVLGHAEFFEPVIDLLHRRPHADFRATNAAQSLAIPATRL